MRNIWCSKYSACLDRAARSRAAGFDCSRCSMVSDTGSLPESHAALLEEIIGGLKMLAKAYPEVRPASHIKQSLKRHLRSHTELDVAV